MRLLCVLLIAAQFTVSLSQDENAKDIFEPSSMDDVVGPADFVGRTEEINEGSDSFAISTAMLEPITEPTTTAAPKHEENTVEPLELTTRIDKNLNSTVQLPIIPSSGEGTQPLPEEAMAADPFSLDEATTTIKTTSEQPLVAPVVPVIRDNNESIAIDRLLPQNTPLETTTSSKEATTTVPASSTPSAPIILPTLEGRVLKEKEDEASTSIRDRTTDVHVGTETTEVPFVTSATTENQDEAATTGVVAGMTHDGSEAEEGHTREIDVTIDAEVTTSAY
ncbi:hypothetical protein Y032_0536g3105 [Ancylostoma ceylanicum]|uniref:Uncharacterized protein n=1 Tax=Ancylostoma ceylanicum TaxID=53326 RepID=A0A016WTD6_9BILA|nr:hypothetical protein Y032_0536g3105 [Ancylostoma ceylanicum]